MNDPDTVPPVAIAEGPCFCAHIRIYDTGPGQSKLSSFRVDTSFNMSFIPDANFIPGAGQDSSYYDICVIDSSIEAYISVSIYDIASNRTTMLSTYKPQFVKFSPSPLNFGTVNVGNTKYLYDTICNTKNNPYNFKGASLVFSNAAKSDDLGFSIDSTGGDGVIPVGGCRVIKIKYTAIAPPTVRDSIQIFNSCLKIIIPVIGKGSVPDFSLSNFDFGCIDLGSTKKLDATVASNFGTGVITIDSVWVEDAVHFTFTGTPKLPFTLKTNAQIPFQFTFAPTTNDTLCTIVHFRSVEVGERTAKLCGCGQTPASVETNIYSSTLSSGSAEYTSIKAKLDHGDDLAILPPMPNPLTHGNKNIRFIYGLKMDSPVDLSIYDILGNPIAAVFHQGSQPAGIYEINFPVGSNMLSGSYIYRLFGARKVISGKLVVAR